MSWLVLVELNEKEEIVLYIWVKDDDNMFFFLFYVIVIYLYNSLFFVINIIFV